MSKMKFAVIGCPIRHTMSPFINSRLFELDGVEADYEVIEVENVADDIEKLKKLNGFNITIPHKKNIIPFLSQMSDKAKLCGSVNTVLIKDGKLQGYTTDGTGMEMSLNRHGLGFTGDILLLGNGGAARAVAFQMLGKFKTLTVAARNIDSAEKFVNEILPFSENKNISFSLLSEIPERSFDLVINTTAAGMYPKPDESPIDEKVLKNCKALYDAVYNPHDTLLIKKAESVGCKAIHGMEMLVNQAAVAHEIWLGENFKKYSTEDINKLVEDSVKEMNRHFYGK